eukprot:52521-Eustigmatos_ZCMA.PRE.1
MVVLREVAAIPIPVREVDALCWRDLVEQAGEPDQPWPAARRKCTQCDVPFGAVAPLLALPVETFQPPVTPS